MAFDDLRDYYGKSDVRNRVRDRMANALQRHADNRVCLIAHSVGSIIAYDVLRMLEQHPPGIDHFVTIGSPLGLPVVITTCPRGVLEHPRPAASAAMDKLS